jgi:hypothetical protein
LFDEHPASPPAAVRRKKSRFLHCSPIYLGKEHIQPPLLTQVMAEMHLRKLVPFTGIEGTQDKMSGLLDFRYSFQSFSGLSHRLDEMIQARPYLLNPRGLFWGVRV